MMNTVASTPTPVKNQRCQPDAPARNEKAAPLLWTLTRLKNEVNGVESPSWKAPRISTLLS